MAELKRSMEEIKTAIIEISENGVMPTMAKWAMHKPKGYPTADQIRNHTNKRWYEVCESFGLIVNHKSKHRENDIKERLVFPSMKKETPTVKRKPEFINPGFLLENSPSH